MGALIALHLRVLWRGAPQGLRFFWVFIPIFGSAFFSTDHVPRESLGSFILLPAFAFLISGMASIQGAEPLTWLVPLKTLTRIQARFWLFAGLGALHAALLLAFHCVTGNIPQEPWIQLALHAWLCFMGSSLLLFTLADLSRAKHAFVRTLAFIFAIAPGFGLTAAHVVNGTPAWVLVAEVVVVAALLAVNFQIHRDLEPATRTPEAGESTDVPSSRPPSPAVDFPPEPLAPIPTRERRIPIALSAPASPRLDHVADPGPVLFGSLFYYPWIWIVLLAWLALAFVPVPFVYMVSSIVILQGIFLRVFQHWAPFQATPISRKTVLRRLFLPILLLWALTLGIQGATIWYDRPTVLDSWPGRFSLPVVRRECEEFLPPQFRSNTLGPGRDLPSSPQSVAPLMSLALRVGYGIDVPADEILALRPAVPLDGSMDPVQREWLRDVERRWEAPMRWKLLQWRIAAGLFVLLAGLVSISTMLRARLPRWLTQAFSWLLALSFLVPVCSASLLNLLPRIPRPLHALYGELFDRPWILTAVLLPLSLLLLIRHARVFCVHSVDLPPIQKRVQEFM